MNKASIRRISSRFYCLRAYVSYVPTATIFTLKNPAEESMEGDGDEAEDDFQTDEDEEMEVEKQVLQKRKKVRGNLNSFCLFVFSVI